MQILLWNHIMLHCRIALYNSQYADSILRILSCFILRILQYRFCFTYFLFCFIIYILSCTFYHAHSTRRNFFYFIMHTLLCRLHCANSICVFYCTHFILIHYTNSIRKLCQNVTLYELHCMDCIYGKYYINCIMGIALQYKLHCGNCIMQIAFCRLHCCADYMVQIISSRLYCADYIIQIVLGGLYCRNCVAWMQLFQLFS